MGLKLFSLLFVPVVLAFATIKAEEEYKRQDLVQQENVK